MSGHQLLPGCIGIGYVFIILVRKLVFFQFSHEHIYDDMIKFTIFAPPSKCQASMIFSYGIFHCNSIPNNLFSKIDKVRVPQFHGKSEVSLGDVVA